MMPYLTMSPAATAVHAVRKGSAACGAWATHEVATTAGRTPCKRCVKIVEKGYGREVITAAHWETYAGVAALVNANWGPRANPILMTKAQRADTEQRYLATMDRPTAPVNVNWVRTLSDGTLMDALASHFAAAINQ